MRVRDPAEIRRWRKQRRYSQRELAFLCGKSQNAIFLVESGQMTTLTEDFAMAIASRLDVPWERLFEVRTAPSALRIANAVYRSEVQDRAS